MTRYFEGDLVLVNKPYIFNFESPLCDNDDEVSKIVGVEKRKIIISTDDHRGLVNDKERELLTGLRIPKLVINYNCVCWYDNKVVLCPQYIRSFIVEMPSGQFSQNVPIMESQLREIKGTELNSKLEEYYNQHDDIVAWKKELKTFLRYNTNLPFIEMSEQYDPKAKIRLKCLNQK